MNSRNLSSGLVASTKSASHRALNHHPFNYSPLRSSSDSGAFPPSNGQLFSGSGREASGCSLTTNLGTNNPIFRFYFDPVQPWAPPGLADPVPNAPLRRNTVCHSSPSNFDRSSGPHSDLGSAASGVCRSDSGYGGSQIVGSRSNKVAEPSNSVRRYHEGLLPLDHFSHFQTMTGLPPTPHSDGADSHLASTPRNNSTLECHICGVKSKCPSDHKKHMLKHEKPFRCTQPGCSRTQGFITVNDLNRHLKSVHKVKVNCRTRSFKCASAKCRNPDKEWPRLDNFKQHIIRMHPDENLQDLIDRSELKDDYANNLVLDNALAGMDASKYQSEGPSTSPANLMLTSATQPFSSGWNAIQSSANFAENETRLPPISSTTSGFFQSDRPKGKSPRLSHSQPIHSSKRLPSVSFSAVSPPSSSAGLSTLAEAAVADASVRQPTAHPLANFLRLGPSVQAVLNPEVACNTEEKDPLQSLSALIANSIKNSNGSPLEERIYRAITQVVDFGTQHPGAQNQSDSPKHRHGPSPYHDDNGAGVSDNRVGGREEIVDAEEVKKKLESMANIMRKQKSRERKSSKSNGRTCEHCNKILSRACDMNKHIKRHTRPFGCTFYKCHKSFGSKNDWKRHENSQHFQIEMFRCHISDSSKRHGVCAKIFYARSAFEEHLRDGHKISDDRLVSDHLQEGRIGRGHQGRFWCGFCKKILPLREQGVPGWDERFNHIDNHFKQGLSVETWVDAETNQTKDEMKTESHRSRRDQQSDEEEEDNLSTSSSSSGDIPTITVTAPAGNAKKRKASDDEGAGPPPEWVYFCVRPEIPDLRWDC